MPSALRSLVSAVLAAGVAGAAWSQAGIYTCVDGKGRRLTSDRPIPECLDREQRELNPSGTVRRTVGPSLTASERAEQEERERKLAEERQHEAEEKRVNKALLARYPNVAAHAADRAKAIQAVEDAIVSGRHRIAELQHERRKLDQETEFYKSPAQWPGKLKRQIDENTQQIAAQERFIQGQEEEKKRIDHRYDQELAKLRDLWAKTAAATAAASGPVKR